MKQKVMSPKKDPYEFYLEQGLKDVNDSVCWANKANTFMALSLWIIRENMITGESSSDILPFVGIDALPTNASIGLELFMKAYLLACGWTIKDIRSKNHNLESLRLACLKYDQQAFNDLDLKDVCGEYGNYVTGDGGLKYPGRPNPEIRLSSYEYALKHLRKTLKLKLNSRV